MLTLIKAFLVERGLRKIAADEESLGRPLTEGERLKVGLLMASPLILFSLFAFWKAGLFR